MSSLRVSPVFIINKRLTSTVPTLFQGDGGELETDVFLQDEEIVEEDESLQEDETEGAETMQLESSGDSQNATYYNDLWLPPRRKNVVASTAPEEPPSNPTIFYNFAEARPIFGTKGQKCNPKKMRRRGCVDTWTWPSASRAREFSLKKRRRRSWR